MENNPYVVATLNTVYSGSSINALPWQFWHGDPNGAVWTEDIRLAKKFRYKQTASSQYHKTLNCNNNKIAVLHIEDTLNYKKIIWDLLSDDVLVPLLMGVSPELDRLISSKFSAPLIRDPK